MKVTLEIEGPIGCGKTRLAIFIENKLLEGYSIEFVSREELSCPGREICCYNIEPLKELHP